MRPHPELKLNTPAWVFCMSRCNLTLSSGGTLGKKRLEFSLARVQLDRTGVADGVVCARPARRPHSCNPCGESLLQL